MILIFLNFEIVLCIFNDLAKITHKVYSLFLLKETRLFTFNDVSIIAHNVCS